MIWESRSTEKLNFQLLILHYQGRYEILPFSVAARHLQVTKLAIVQIEDSRQLRFDSKIWIHPLGLSIFLLESTCELIHSFGGPNRVSTELMNGENECLWFFVTPSATSCFE
jgi:hypothetical protein